MTVLILGGDDDAHARHMRDHLRRAGAEVHLLDSRLFPAALTLSFDPASGEGAIGLADGRRVASREVRSVYWRSYHGAVPPELPDAAQDFIARNDSRGLFESMLLRLPALWVNGLGAYRLHQTKPAQLAIVAGLGVRVPATLVTNSADDLARFARAHPAAIFKPVQGGAHTRPLTAAHLAPGKLELLRLAPVTVQEAVPGTNIRVFVADGAEPRVLACEIATPHLDFRDDEAPDVRPHPLPPGTEAECLAIARALDLLWTGIDFRLTPEGAYVFLEANPSPMFIEFERLTGLPLTEALAGLLLA